MKTLIKSVILVLGILLSIWAFYLMMLDVDGIWYNDVEALGVVIVFIILLFLSVWIPFGLDIIERWDK